MPTYPNLTHRLARPAAGRGRIQKAARRVLLLLDGEATTRDVASWGYCRKVQRGQRIEKADYRHVRRALDRIAVRVGRAGGVGRPILWRLGSAIGSNESSASDKPLSEKEK